MKIPFFSQRQNKAAQTVPSPNRQLDPADAILQYHEETKHHYYRFARSLGYLDWDNQPNPFRRFQESPFYPLPLLPIDDAPSFASLYIPEAISPQELSLNSLSRFFGNALAISAWKRQLTAHWSLRVNPSSGNLHPTEGYLILNHSLAEIPGGVYHYAPREHALEQRAEFKFELPQNFPADSFLVGLTSIHWREAWKYGERAFRYCQHDIGHAIAALRISAAVLGWQLIIVDELSDFEVARMLGLDRAKDFEQAEDEAPECLAFVTSSRKHFEFSSSYIDAISNSEWKGHANLLSESHIEWQIIDLASAITVKNQTPIVDPNSDKAAEHTKIPDQYHMISAERIIQQRRSCLALDGSTSISRDVFYSMMTRVNFSVTRVPFDCLMRSEMRVPRVHLAIFVHRVDGLPSGLYFLVRNSDAKEQLKAAMNSSFVWNTPAECPESLGLYLLESGDFRDRATGVSCGQEIGGDGAFSLGMIAEMEEAIRNIGPWMYKRLFWESGVIGQILYLEAEAAGIRGTGIGCFFDDPMHELLGLKDRRLQDIYHFTMGGPIEDQRLTTEPPYQTR